MGRYNYDQTYNITYLQNAHNHNLPLWYRVANICWARALSDGHAWFEKGELCAILLRVNKETNIAEPETSNHICRAIREAKTYGQLDPNSNTRCLVRLEGTKSGGMGVTRRTCHRHEDKDSDE